MNRFVKLLAVIGFLVIAAHRLPAPIVEPEEKPTPAPEHAEAPNRKHSTKSTTSEKPSPAIEKAKPASAKRKSVEPSESNSAQRFDGIWQAVEKSPATDMIGKYTLTVRGKSAELTGEETRSNPRGSPYHIKWTNHSGHMVTDGPNLMVRWVGRRLVDWGPKQLPIKYFEQWAKQNESSAGAFTLKGDELVVSNSGFVYHRVK